MDPSPVSIESCDSGVSASTHSSESEGDSIRFHTPPLGPLSACDIYETLLVFFEEKHNRVVVVDQDTDTRSTYNIPEDYSFAKYYWASIYFVDRSTILCLLKHHASRLFSLATFALDSETKCVRSLDVALTDIQIQGYQICSQRSDHSKHWVRFFYSFTNRRPSKKAKKQKLMKSVSDRTLFRDQMQQVLEAQSQSVETKSLQPINTHRRTVSTESEQVSTSEERPRMEEEMSTEAVMLECTVSLGSGSIAHRVLSVGRRTVRLRVSTSRRGRSFADSLRVKQMNRLSAPKSPTSSSSSFSSTLPFLLAGHAVFIDKDSSSSASVIRVKDGDTRGLIGAVVNRVIKPLGSRRVDLHHVSIGGTSPEGGEGAVWSDFHVERDDAYVAVQSWASSPVRMWKLSVTNKNPLQLSWSPLNELPLTEADQRVREMRLSVSPDMKACCIRGSRTKSAESDDSTTHFCMTFDRTLLVA